MAWLSQETMRRDSTSGRQPSRMPSALQRDPFVDQRAAVGAGDTGFGRAQMAQPGKVKSSAAHSSDGGSMSKIERPSQITTLPAKANRPE